MKYKKTNDYRKKEKKEGEKTSGIEDKSQNFKKAL